MSITVPFVDLSWQHDPLAIELAQAMEGVLRRGDFILGQGVQGFERAFSEYSQARYGVGVACGTDAVGLALQACGIGPGDEVLLPTNTFIATLLGVCRTGAKPVFVDCDRLTALIDLEKAAHAITPYTRAIVAVHLYGQMVAPGALLDFAQAYDLKVIEDAAQAHGACREGYRAGSVGQAAAFSFYPSKNLGGMGDGGMVLTATEAIEAQLRILRNYGAPQKYVHTEVGTNSRLDTLQASILQVKLPHLDQWNQERWQAAQQYDRYFQDCGAELGIRPLQNESGEGHIYHLYVVELERPIDRAGLQAYLNQHQIQTGIHYPIPCHLQPAFKFLGYNLGDFPVAEYLCDRIMSLPIYPGIQPQQVDYVCEMLRTGAESCRS
jgi:dTDP-4-amino-4,6-dideoxygalactose transaminase